MNDRFKFKGQTKKGKWIYGSLLWYADEPQIWDEEGNNFIVKSETVGQCTGLKDKNGKLVYEGDILFEDWKNEVYPNGKYWIVKWNKNQANFYIEMINPSKFENCSEWHLARHDLDYEVIGNIYMDSHLLDISNNL